MTEQRQATGELPQLSVTIRRTRNGGYLLHDMTDQNDIAAATTTAPEIARVLLDMFQNTMGESPYQHVMPQQVLPPTQQPIRPAAYSQPGYASPPPPPEEMPQFAQKLADAKTLADQIADLGIKPPPPVRPNGGRYASAMLAAIALSLFFRGAIGV